MFNIAPKPIFALVQPISGMTILTIALDRSARRVDADGRLHIDRSHISKATVNPYYGHEIPSYTSLGLDPNQIYQLLREPTELEKAAPTFARLPILSEHVPVNIDEPRQDLIVGTIGSEVIFDSPYLDADLCIWDASAITGIETDRIKELSCAYRYKPVMESGVFDGESYDGRMTEIQGNHLALVEIGRAGHDVVVADHNPFTKEINMKMSKLGKVIYMTLSAASPKLAADAALPALVGAAEKNKFNWKEIKPQILALDADVDANQLDDMMDTILGSQDPNPIVPPDDDKNKAITSDDSLGEQLKTMLNGKVDGELLNKIVEMCSSYSKPMASDADEEDNMKNKDDGMKKEDVKAAMDALRKDLRSAEEARRDVREIVGDVFDIEAAPDVYKFALDHMKVDCKDVKDEAALRALFKVAAKANKTVPHTPRFAQDAANSLEKKLPQVFRFRTA